MDNPTIYKSYSLGFCIGFPYRFVKIPGCEVASTHKKQPYRTSIDDSNTLNTLRFNMAMGSPNVQMQKIVRSPWNGVISARAIALPRCY